MLFTVSAKASSFGGLSNIGSTRKKNVTVSGFDQNALINLFICKIESSWLGHSTARSLLKTGLLLIYYSPEHEFNWVRLFRAATSCLRQPDRGGTRKRKSLATILNQQIQEFENADNDRLLVAGNRISEKTMKRKSDPADNTGRKISEKFDEGDVRGAVRLASTDATIAPLDSTTLEKLERKHPKTPLDRRVYPQNG